jgi:hypothetical protein
MTTTRMISRSRSLYALLLKLYPREHRAGYAVPMLQVFTDQCREAFTARGGLGIILLWLRTLPDLGRSALLEHVTSPTAAWGLMEPVPGAPLPWKGVLLVLLPGLVYLVSQIAQLTGQPWYMTVYYRAAFFLILPPLAVWILTRRFPLWGLIPVGLLFRLLQDMTYQIIYLSPFVRSSDKFINSVLTALKTVKLNTLIVAGFFTACLLLLAWRYLRREKLTRKFWLWTGLYILISLMSTAISLNWVVPYFTDARYAFIQNNAWNMFWDSIGYNAFTFSALLLLIFLGTLFTRRHGIYTILILVGYLLPTQVIGIPWNQGAFGNWMLLIGAGVLAFRALLSFVTPIWMSRVASQSGKVRVVLGLAGLAFAIHIAMQFFPGIYYQNGDVVTFAFIMSVLLEDLKWFCALLVALALYREVSAQPDDAPMPLGVNP